MGGEIHQGPGPPAERPGLIAAFLLQARFRLGRAGGVEGDAEIGSQRLRLPDRRQLRFLHPLEQARLAARQPLALVEIDQTLKVDLSDLQPLRQADEGRQLPDRLPEAREPERDFRLQRALLALQGREAPQVTDDLGEHVAAADQGEGLGLGGVQRHPELVQPGTR